MPELDPGAKAAGIASLFRRREATAVLPPDLAPATLEEGYRIRRAFEALESAAGRGPVAGYKIALTTKVMQQLCGIDEPCYGAIFAREVHHRRATLRAADYCRMAIESEIAVKLGEDLPEGGDRERVAAAVESCTAAIELLEDLRFDYARLNAPALVAANAWNAGIVLGAPVAEWRRLDLAALTARLSINGTEIGRGQGSAVMGHPLNALAWLADRLAADGTPLKGGMIVTTGSIVATQHPLAGDRSLVEIDGLGTAELVLT